MEMLWTVLRIGCLILTLSDYSRVTAVYYFRTPPHNQHESNFYYRSIRPPVQYVPTISRHRIDEENNKVIHHVRRTSRKLAATTSIPSTIPYTNIYDKWTTGPSKAIGIDIKTNLEKFNNPKKNSPNIIPYLLPGLDIKVFQKKITGTTSKYNQELTTSQRGMEKNGKTQPTEVNNTIDEKTLRFSENVTDLYEQNSKTTTSGNNDQLKELRSHSEVSTTKEIIEGFTSLPAASGIYQSENTVTTIGYGEFIEVERRSNGIATLSNDAVTIKDNLDDSWTNKEIIEGSDSLPAASGIYQSKNTVTTIGYGEFIEVERRSNGIATLSTDAVTIKDNLDDSWTNKEIIEGSDSLPAASGIYQSENTVTTIGYGEVIEVERQSNGSATLSTDAVTIKDNLDDCWRKVVGVLKKASYIRDWEQANDSFDPLVRRNNKKDDARLDCGAQNLEINDRNDETILNSSNCASLGRTEHDVPTSKSNSGKRELKRIQCYSCSNESTVHCNEPGLFTPRQYCEPREVCIKVVTRNTYLSGRTLQRSCAPSDACTNRHTSPTTERSICVTCSDPLCNAGVSNFNIMTFIFVFLVAVVVIL